MERAPIARELAENEDFDPCTISAAAPFTQGKVYGLWQRSLGRVVRRFVVEERGRPVAYFQCIVYPLLRGKNYVYLPYGPVVSSFSEPILACIEQTLGRVSREEGAVFARLDFSPRVPESAQLLLKRHFSSAPLCTYHSSNFQPRAEWVVDLHESEEALLSHMHEKTRYSIRLAERKGVVSKIVEHDLEPHFDAFYALMKGTSKRNGFRLHEEAYYRRVFASARGTRDYLAIAEYEGEILAINFMHVFGGTANFVFGGSSDAKRNVMPSHAIQWAAILHAKKLGCATYSFGGYESGPYTNPGWEGFSTFKQKFGGRMESHSTLFDLVSEPLWYYLYTARKFIKNLV